MDDSGVVLKTAETWKKHETAANVYSEQLSYTIFRPLSNQTAHLHQDFWEAVLAESGYFEWIDGFSVPTGRHKIINSDMPVIIASRELNL
jgi:UDP-N-acetylmuramyl tripeptide synthase